MCAKRSFWISFFIVLLYALGSYGYNLIQYWGRDVSAVYARTSLACTSADGDMFVYFQLLFPFIVVFPFATSFFEDVENKSIGFWIRRSGKKRYYISKLAACFIGCFIVILVPFLINLILVWVTFPSTAATNWGTIYSEEFFQNLYDFDRMKYDLFQIHFFIRHPVLYELGIILAAAIFAGIFGVVAFAFSIYIRKYKILIFLPVYILFFLLDRLNVMVESMNFSLLDYVTVSTNPNKNYILFFGICLFFLVVSSIIIYRQSKKDVL